MKAVIHPNFSKENCARITEKVCSMLSNMGFELFTYTRMKDKFAFPENVSFGEEEDIIPDADFIIVIGGDGTILEASRSAAEYDRPLLGINTGRLGFMAALEYDEIYRLTGLLSGNYTAQERMLLDCVYLGREGERVYTALNDVVLSSRFGHMVEFDVKIGDMNVSHIRADGVIFSTPTGSTAYALSAGGPILSPDIKCIEMTPVCPHSLFSRTMVFSPEKELEIITDVSRTDVYLTVDGVSMGNIKEYDKVKIRCSKKVLRLIDTDGSTFFRAVNDKLMRPVKGSS
ncbi:MAG: NAD(+)/NADH kinase [Oscillospiraceae bacterium]|nr:NAD(+)/NADH kinase [Oscillospiraceae bacterium]